MSILLEINQIKEGLCQSFATSRDSTDPLVLTEYRLFFNRVQHNDTLSTAVIQAVCELNLAYVRHQLKLVTPAEIDQHLTSAIDWNIAHEEKIASETLVYTYVLRASADLIFDAAALSTILADLDEAICIAYCDQTCKFSTVAEVHRIRSSIFEKMGNYVEAREAKREAFRLSEMENDYKKLIRRPLKSQSTDQSVDER